MYITGIAYLLFISVYFGLLYIFWQVQLSSKVHDKPQGSLLHVLHSHQIQHLNDFWSFRPLSAGLQAQLDLDQRQIVVYLPLCCLQRSGV